MDFRWVPTIPKTDKTVSLCLNSASNMVYAEHQLSLWSLEFGYVPGRGGCLCDQPQMKTLGRVSNEPLWLATFYTCQNLSEELSMSYMILGLHWKRTLEVCTWLPSDISYAFFPLTNFALYPLTVINHNCEYN